MGTVAFFTKEGLVIVDTVDVHVVEHGGNGAEAEETGAGCVVVDARGDQRERGPAAV